MVVMNYKGRMCGAARSGIFQVTIAKNHAVKAQGLHQIISHVTIDEADNYPKQTIEYSGEEIKAESSPDTCGHIPIFQGPVFVFEIWGGGFRTTTLRVATQLVCPIPSTAV